MTDKSHLDGFANIASDGLAKSLIQEFVKLVRDPDIATASYPTRLRAVMDDRLQATDDAPG